jgi:hypothetical protein
LLDLYRDSASPAASDTIGEIEFNGEDSAGNKQQYAVIHASILSPTSTAETGQIHFETATAGASTEKMIIGSTNLVINDIGAIYNVRIEGDTDANLLYTDATNSRVGIGILTPAEKLEVVGNIKLSGNVVVASGKGIDFSATPSGSGTMTSELLADYEEGTWNAVISDGTNDATMTNTTCRYTLIGRQVFVNGRISTSSLGSVSGALQIKGLPFATAAFSSSAFGYGGSFSLVAGQTVGGYTASSGSIIFLSVWSATGGITAMTSTQWTATGDLVIGFSYTV